MKLRSGIDKEMFGSDDWLTREIERENRISAWDLDEGKSLRKEHAENCDARDNARQHERFHQATQRTVTTRKKENVQRIGNAMKGFFVAEAILMMLSPFSVLASVLCFASIFGFIAYVVISTLHNNSFKGE